MRIFLLTLGCLASIGLLGQSNTEAYQEILESFAIEGYAINNEVFAYSKSKQNPVYTLRITLKGKPADTSSKVSAAEINFYRENDPRLNQQPVFNEGEKYIIAHYPMAAFDHWMTMLKLKKKKTRLTFNFVSSPSKNIRKAFLLLEENF